MDGLRILSLALSLLALVALSTASLRIAGAESAGIVPTQPGSDASCQAKSDSTQGRGKTANIADLSRLEERLAATPLEDDFVPLNNQGYHYQAQQTPSNALLFFDGELQRPSPAPPSTP